MYNIILQIIELIVIIVGSVLVYFSMTKEFEEWCEKVLSKLKQGLTDKSDPYGDWSKDYQKKQAILYRQRKSQKWEEYYTSSGKILWVVRAWKFWKEGVVQDPEDMLIFWIVVGGLVTSLVIPLFLFWG